MEITRDIAKGLIEHCPEDLKPGEYIQEAEAFLAQDFEAINKKMIMLLERLCVKKTAVQD